MIQSQNLIVAARHFARDAHKRITLTTVSGDVRGQFEHLQEVADLVWSSGGSDVEIAAAWLHDTVEDTPTTLEGIKEKFGTEVMEIVRGLTDPIEFKSLTNAERKPKQAERVANESSSVKRIKLADQISNVRFVATDPKPSWTFESNCDYIIGAKLIAEQCSGVSSILDQLFEAEYGKAAKSFNNLKII